MPLQTQTHSSRFLRLIQTLKSQGTLAEISPQALQAQAGQLAIIDVRESQEYEQGAIPNALHLSKGILERDIEKYIQDPDTPIVLYCSGGYRSVLAADNLYKMGYTKVYSLVGGFKGWLEAGFEST